MPFVKTGRNTYMSPSGRKMTLGQMQGYYRGGGQFPGSAGMRDQFPKSHFSPTAPGAAAKPDLVKSGREDATSSTPTSILRGGKETFGPLEYSRKDGNQEYWSSDRIADRERRRASAEFNSMQPEEAPKNRRK